jgi:hypothetical protein
MTDADFQKAVLTLRDLPFREAFEAALCDLYRESTPPQRDELRERYDAGLLEGPKPWRNPADFGRSDLTREQRMRQSLMLMSIREGGPDYRDDLVEIAYCYHNLALLGVDADAVLKEIGEMSGPNVAGLLLGFVRRSPQDKSLEAWRLRVAQTPYGPIAEFTT